MPTPSSSHIRPMLARRFTPKHLHFPCYVQRKLDGIRATFLPTSPVPQSRPKPPDYKPIFWLPGTLPFIEDSMKLLREARPTYVFDGELYSHDLSLQAINSRVAVKRTSPHPDITSISYIIFDFLDLDRPLLPTHERAADLLVLLSTLPLLTSVRIMPLEPCHSRVDFDSYFSYCLSSGYEGLIYRRWDAPYTTSLVCNNRENRTWDMMKRKESLDTTATITDLIEGKGRLSGSLGAIVVRDDSGATFSVGTGFSDADRLYYWSLGSRLIGTSCRIEFRRYSDNKVPLEPRIVSIDY